MSASSTVLTTAAPGSTAFDTPVTYVATVTGGSDGDLVTFYDGTPRDSGHTVGTNTLTGGVASLVLNSPIGTHSISAVYAGNVGGAVTSTSNAISHTVTEDDTHRTVEYQADGNWGTDQSIAEVPAYDAQNNWGAPQV